MSMFAPQTAKLNLQGIAPSAASTGIRFGVNQSTILGYNAAPVNQGFRATYIGEEAGLSNKQANDCIVIGYRAGLRNQADNNIFLGNQCSISNITGSENVVVGNQTNRTGLTNNRNVIMGFNAGDSVVGCNNCFMGYENGNSVATVNTNNNTSVGFKTCAFGGNSVSVGANNLVDRGAAYSVQVGNSIRDKGTGNILIGNGISNVGSNCIIMIPGNGQQTYFNRSNNFINIGNKIVATSEPGSDKLNLSASEIQVAVGTHNIITMNSSYLSLFAESNILVNGLIEFYKTANFHSNVVIDNALTVQDDATFSNNVFVRNLVATDLVIDSNATFSNDVLVLGQLTTRYNLSASNLTTVGDTVLGNELTVTSNATFSNDVLVLGQLTTRCNLVASNMTTVGDTLVGNELTVASNATFSNDVLVLGQLMTLCNLNAPNLATPGDAMIGSRLFVSSNATFSNDMTVQGSATIGSELTVASNATFSNDVLVQGQLLTRSDLTAMGTAIIGSELTVASNATFSNDVLVQGQLLTRSNLTAMGTAIIGSELTVASNANFSNDVLVQGQLIAASNLTAQGSAIIGSELTVASNANFSNDVLVQGQLIAASNLTAQGSATIGSELTVASNANFSNDVLVQGQLIAASNLAAQGSATIGSELTVASNANFSNDVLVQGQLIAASNLAAQGSATIGSELTVASNANFSNDVLVHGELQAKDNLSVGGSASISSNLEINGSLSIRSDLDVYGTTRFHNTILFDSNVVMSSNATLQVQDVIVTGSFIMADGSSTNLKQAASSNDSTLSNVTVGGNLTVLGRTTLCNDVSLAGGSLTVSGKASFASGLSVDTVSLPSNASVFRAACESHVLGVEIGCGEAVSHINIGTGGVTPTVISIGGVGDTVMIPGSLTTVTQCNIAVRDKVIRLNQGGVPGTGYGSGFEIEEGGNVAGYVRTGTDRASFLFKAPAASRELRMDLSGCNVNFNSGTLFMSNSGAVGIGTTTPMSNVKLDVAGFLRAQGILCDGQLTVSDKATLARGLDVGGDAGFKGVATFSNQVTALCNLMAPNGMQVGGNTSLSNVSITGQVTMDGPVVVKGHATYCNDLTIGGNLIVPSGTTLSNVSVVGTSSFCNTTYLNDVHIGGNVWFDAGATISNASRLKVTGNGLIEIDQVLSVKDMVVCGGLTLCNGVVGSITQHYGSNGYITYSNIEGDTVTEYTGTVVVDQNLYVGGRLYIGGGHLTVSGVATFNDHLTANRLTVYGVCDVGSNLIAEMLTVNRQAYLASNLTFGSNASLSNPGRLVVTGTGEVDFQQKVSFQDLIITGTLTMCNGEMGGITNMGGSNGYVTYSNIIGDPVTEYAGTVVIDQNLYVGGRIFVGGGHLTVTSTATFNDHLYANKLTVYGLLDAKALSVSDYAYLASNLSFGSNASLSNPGRLVVTGTGEVDFQQKLAVTDLVVHGSITLCNSDFGGVSNVGCSHGYVTYSNIVGDVVTEYSGSVVIDQNLYVGGKMYIGCSHLTVTSISSFESNLYANTLTVYGLLDAKTLSVSDYAYFASNVSFGSNASLSNPGRLVVTGTGEVDFQQTVGVQELVIHGSISFCNGDFAGISNLGCHDGYVTYSNVIGDVVTEYLGSVVIDQNLYVGGRIYVGCGHLNVTGVSSFSSNVYAKNLTVEGPISGYGNLAFSGSNLLGSNLDYWDVMLDIAPSRLSADLVFKSINGALVTFTDDFQPEVLNFTGRHRLVLEDSTTRFDQVPFKAEPGHVVVSAGRYCDLNGKATITIDEALPVVRLSTRPNDKSVVGVLGKLESDSVTFALGNMRFVRGICCHDDNDDDDDGRRVVVQSSGEGCIWVCDENGDIENGDLLCTSSVPGHAMVQEDGLVRNVTIAKATCDYRFRYRSPFEQSELASKTVHHNGKDYRCVMIGCIYMC
jgi:predicted acyltransferase (DUF342 family)